MSRRAPSDEPIDERRERARDRRRADDALRRLGALAPETEWNSGEKECEDPASDVLGAQPEQQRVVDVEVVRIAESQHDAPHDPGDEGGDARNGPACALTRPGVPPPQDAAGNERRKQRAYDVEDDFLHNAACYARWRQPRGPSASAPRRGAPADGSTA